MSAKAVQSKVIDNTLAAHDIIKAYWDGIFEDLSSGQNVIIRRNNKPMAVVIPYEDYLAIQETLENYQDGREAEAILARIKSGEEEVVPWEAVKAELFPEGLPDD